MAGLGIAGLTSSSILPPRVLPFFRSKVHTILRDRSYIGEVPYRNEWLQGNHESLIERDTWNRVQAIFGHKVYRQNELTYAGGLIVCGHCGHAITGEQVTKKTTLIREQQDKLLNLRLLEEIDAATFAKKQRELRDREADIGLRMEAADRSHHEMVDLAVKVFELSQALRDKWLTANCPEKRQILEILCLNYRLE